MVLSTNSGRNKIMLGLLDLQTQIREGSLLPFYIFTGEENKKYAHILTSLA